MVILVFPRMAVEVGRVLGLEMFRVYLGFGSRVALL